MPIHTLSRSDAVEACLALAQSDCAHQLVTVNSLLLLESEKNPAIKEICRAATLVLSDSSGISWAARVQNRQIPDRFPGVDLAIEIVSRCAAQNLSVFFFGGAPGVAEQASDALKRTLPTLKIAGIHHGFLSEANKSQLVDEIRRARPRLILVALGMPKQDQWIHDHLGQLPPGLYMGVGGSFDIWSGRAKRAPAFFQRSGLEWFYRWIQEPQRTPRMLKLPLFAWRVLLEKYRRS